MVEVLKKAREGLFDRGEKSRAMEYPYKLSRKFTNMLQFHPMKFLHINCLLPHILTSALSII